MAKPNLFEIKPPITRTQMVQAIYDAELERWQKAEKTRSPNQPPAPQPDMKAVQAAFGTMDPTEAMLSYATGGKVKTMPDADYIFSKDEAKAIGAVLLQVEKGNEKKGEIHPNVIVTGADGEQYKLEPKEFSGWLQARAKAERALAVDQWVRDHKIGLTGHGSSLENGDEELYFEIHEGQRRVVGNGIESEPMDGYYGGIKKTKVGADSDLLDIYVSKDIYTGIKGGKAYTGPVFVMQQMKDGKPEEMKVGFAEDVDEFRGMMTSTWQNPDDFRKQNEGRYAELTYEQYKQLKKALAKDPNLTLEKFIAGAGLQMADVERIPKVEEEAPARDEGAPEADRQDVNGVGGGEEASDVTPPPRQPPQGTGPQQGGSRRPMATPRR